MAREGFIGSLGLLVLLCSVSRSTQQFIPDHTEIPVSVPRSGFQLDVEEKSAAAAANALAQVGLGHPAPVTTTWSPPTYPPPPPPPPPPSNGCVYPDQIIYERDIYGECLVCVCVQRPYGMIERVCGRCDQCPRPTPTPPTTPPAPPPPPPPPPTTTMRPKPLPSCDPFPTNKPFVNPIDPCLICICNQATPFAKPSIDCVANPECVIPSTTPPPGPPPPDPTICDKYPHDIYFPHPLYPCFICKCTQWPYEPVQLQCVPNPDCDPTTPRPPPPPPPPPPTTTLVPPTPQPPPTPWVDPLPGPSPHPSCRPFIPDVIFQHPWDPCLDCVCTESHVRGITNVQITCFTKAECCIIPDGPTTPYYPPVTTHLPIIMTPSHIGSSANSNAVVVSGGGSMNMPGSPGSSMAQADAAAEAAAQAQAAADAVQANFVNQYPYIQPPSGSAQAQAQAMAQAQANQALAQALAEANAGGSHAVPPSYYNPNLISPGGYGDANANANANAIVNSFMQQPNYYPGMGGGQAQANSNAQAGWGSANAQADAVAQGNAQAQADAQAQSNGYGSSGWSPVQDALAQAQANAQNSLYSMPQQVPMMPYGYGGSSAQAQAEAEADGNGSAQAAANALAQELAKQAQASAQASANAQFYQPQPNPLFNAPSYAAKYGGEAEAQAQAEAIANSNRGVEASAQAQASASSSALRSGDSDAGVMMDSQY